MIGVRNNGRTIKSVEVWANELRLQEFSNEGGWAAQAALNIQLSDLGSINLTGHIEKAGFGGQAALTATIENYPSYKAIDGFQLAADIKAQVDALGAHAAQHAVV